MAKRKRLEAPKDTIPAGLETKSAFSERTRMPIADVAGDTAGRAALEEVAREMTAAEEEGRVVKRLALSDIERHHLSRDRLVLDDEELEALKASIAERGQQTAIEVVRLPGGKYGLISGLRRLEALRQLGASDALALVKAPDSSQAAYRAMIEENEIRANLSFYERANIAVAAVGQGVYPDVRKAIAGLFAHAAPAKRSKIANFVTVHAALDTALTFPTAIPEKLGLALAKALETDRKLAARISDALRKTPPQDAAAERRTLERALKRAPQKPAAAAKELVPGLTFEERAGRVILSGAQLDASFRDALRDFAISHAKKRGKKTWK